MQRVARFIRPIASLASASSRRSSAFPSVFARTYAKPAVAAQSELEKEVERINKLTQNIRIPFKAVGPAGENAQVLFIAAKVQNVVDQVASDLAFLRNAAAKIPEFNDVLTTPDIPTPVKRQMLKETLPSLGFNTLTTKFVEELLDDNQLQLILKVAETFQVIVKADRKEVDITVTLANVVPPTTLKQIEGVIRKTYLSPDQSARFGVVINPAVLGGLALTIEDAVIDLTKQKELSVLEERIEAELANQPVDQEILAAEPKWVEE